MKDPYAPDPQWTLQGFTSREMYARQCVYFFDFPTHVHNDIVKSYQTVVHLMAHAWYHYPMYDEALKKLLGMVEMAVKLRCQEVGILLARPGKNGKEVHKNLDKLIDELCSSPQDAWLKNQLHRAREVRNIFAHPAHHSHGGIIWVEAIKLVTKIIEDVFALRHVVSSVAQS